MTRLYRSAGHQTLAALLALLLAHGTALASETKIFPPNAYTGTALGTSTPSNPTTCVNGAQFLGWHSQDRVYCETGQQVMQNTITCGPWQYLVSTGSGGWACESFAGIGTNNGCPTNIPPPQAGSVTGNPTCYSLQFSQ